MHYYDMQTLSQCQQENANLDEIPQCDTNKYLTI